MKSSILATLAYADIFDYPLTKEEIWQWLIGNLKFNEVLKKLVAKKLCGTKEEYYFLPGREKIVEVRKRREGWSKEKIRRAEKVAGILRLIPWIKLIGITGALARKNSDKDDDIDLFFITQRNRLWLTRGLIVLILRILGVYRRPGKIANMICPNMLISESALRMEPEDLFTAHEVCLMKPIFDRDETYLKFLQVNSWVKKFLPNVSIDIKILGHKDVKSRKRKEPSILVSQSLNLLEKLAKFFQLWYMCKRRTTEIVSGTLIKFHPQDAREWVLREYQKRRLAK